MAEERGIGGGQEIGEECVLSSVLRGVSNW